MRSFSRLTQVDPGFRADHLLTVEIALPATRYPTAKEQRVFWTELQRRVAAVPGVEALSVSSGLPFAGASESSFRMAGEPRGLEHAKMAVAYFVDTGYLETLRIPLLAGRTFGPQDAAGTPPVLIVDQALADKFFPGQNAVGQRLSDGMTDADSLEIVGVVGHVAHYGLDGPQPAQYQMYYSYAQLPEGIQGQVAADFTLLVRTRGEPMALAPAVRAAVTAIDPQQPVFAVTTMDEFIARSVAERRFTIALLGVFAGLALLLAAVGLYAVMAHSVTQRTHELGVRMALGAQPGDVVRLVVRQGLVLIGIGVLVGVLGASGLTRVMRSLLSGQVSPTDPLTFAGVTLLLVAVGFVATYIPARRATRVDPMVALRHE
jgi:putative ABC transport system permease protein